MNEQNTMDLTEETAAEAVTDTADEAAALEIRTAAYAEGEAHARAAAAAEMEKLRLALREAEAASARREAEILCAKKLRERNLDEALAEMILPETGAPDEAEIERRADAALEAVQNAAIRILRARAEPIRPGGGSETPITGAMLREMPLARLAELRK